MEAYEGPYNRNDKKNYSTDPRTAEFFLLYQIRVSDEPIYLESNFCYLIYFENLRCANYFLILEALYFKMLYLRCHLQLRGIADRSYIHSCSTSLSLSLIFIGGQVGKQIGWLVMQARANITFAFRQCTNTLFMISILYVLYVSSIVFLFLCYLFQVVSILGLSRNLFLCSLCFSMLFTFFFCLTFLPILYITLSLLLEVTYLLFSHSHHSLPTYLSHFLFLYYYIVFL